MKKILITIPLFLALIFLSYYVFSLKPTTVNILNKGELYTTDTNFQSKVVRDTVKKNLTTGNLPNITNISSTTHDFNIIHDLHDYAYQLLDSARNGDPESQYYLGKALDYCTTFNQFPKEYPDDIDVTILEVSEWWSSRCSGFINYNKEQLDTAKTWYKYSAESGFEPALAYQLSNQDYIADTEENLQLLHQIIESDQLEVFLQISSAIKNDLTSSAWRLIACDYGYDCSNTSFELWRIGQVFTCEYKRSLDELCDTNTSYNGWLKSMYTPEQYDLILKKKKRIKSAIENNTVNTLSFIDIAD